MKLATLLVTLILPLALFAAAPAFAEEEESVEIPVAAPAPPQLEQRLPKPRPVSRTGRLSRMNKDARHCLDLKTNHEIIKCAEQYL